MKMRTKLSVADCRARLASSTDLKGITLSWDPEVLGAVVGEFRGSAFRLHTRKYYSNSFAPFFYGQLTQADGGAILEGGFRMNPFVRLFMTFWFGFLLIFTVGAIMVPPAPNPASGAGRFWFYTGLALVAVLGVGLVLLGKWLGRGDQAVIRAFIKNTLEAGDM
jgi:hypothetical protein